MFGDLKLLQASSLKPLAQAMSKIKERERPSVTRGRGMVARVQLAVEGRDVT
jgi:hypothetical protein